MDIRSIFESVGSDDPIRSAFESVGSNSFDEQKFQSWYAAWAKKAGIDPDPDNPEHYYDYRAAFSAGVEPSIDPADKQYHWPSQFKKEGHPRMVLDGVNTKTGQPVDPIRSAFEAAAGQSGPQLGPPVDVRALRGEPTRTITDAISAVVPQEPANQSFAQDKPVYTEPKLSPRPVNAGGPQLSQRPPQIEPKKAVDQGIRQASADTLNFLKALKAKEVRALEERLGADDPLVVKEKAKVWDDSPLGKFQKRLEVEIAQDPLPRPEGFKGYVQDMVRALPQVGASVGATYVGGPAAGMAATGSMIAGATERKLSQARVDEKGRLIPAVKDPERRWKAAIFNAAGQSFLEQIPLSRALATWKPGAAAKSVIAEMSKTGALEWFIEMIQKVPELMSSVWARGAGKSPGQMLDEFTEGVGQALKEGVYEGAVVAPVSMLIGGGGAAMGKIKAGPQPIQADEIETLAQAKAFGIVADKDMTGDLKAARADAIKQRDRLTALEDPRQDEIAVADLDNKIGLYDEALRNADNMQKVRQAFEAAAQEQTEPIGSQIVENEPQSEERLTDEPQQPPTLPEDQRTSEQPGEPAASGPGQQFDPVRSAFEAAEADATTPAVPDLATTEDAISFGEAATDQQVSELERLREQTKARLAELNAVPVESRDWNAVSQEAFKSQLYREAIEASRGEHPSQLEAGRPMYWDGDGKTQLSAEDVPADTVETDQPPQLTSEQRQAVQKIYGAEIPILRTVFGKDLADRISVELKQMIDLGGANTDESLANWKARGVKPNTVLGATTFRGQRALMEISLAQDAKRQQWTFDHETFHIAAEWVLPPDQYTTVLKAYGGNTEAAADGFARFMNGKSQPPEGIKKIFMQLKELLRRMGNFLRGSGFTSAEKIFGDIAAGGYAGKRRAGTGMYQGKASMTLFNLDADNPGGMPPREPYARRPKSKNAIELPELTEMIKVLNSGKAPKLFQRMRDALGLFQHNDLAGIADVMIDPDLVIGQPIERAVIRLKGKTPVERKASLNQQMQDFKDSVLSRYNVDPADMVFKSQYHRASGETHLSAIRKDPDVAAKVLSHELGHLDDWWAAAGDTPMVQGRGNILGRIAKLKGYINEYLAEYPGSPDEALTAADIGRLQKEAAKQKLDETTGKIIVEEIIREVPRFAETGVTAETILEIMRGRMPGESNIEVYRFLQTADSQTKKEVVKKALQDIVDERVPQTGRTQVGVDYVKETVTRRQAGKMPTQKEINERFKELLRKEIIKRKLYERTVVMGELKELTQQWKPFDLNISKKYTAYRHKSSELYADAVSVMLQEPELLKSVAPTFDKAMKMYASVRPDFTETLEGIRKDISGSQIGPRRLGKLYEMYERGEKVIADFYIRNRMEKRSLADTLFIILTDRNHGVLKQIRAAEKSGDPELIAKARKARYGLEEAQYIASEMSAYVTDTVKNVIDPMMEKGAAITDLGVYLFGRHVQANRKDLVSPGGHTSTTVEPMLEALEQKLGPEKYQAVKDAAEKYRKIREKYIIPRIEQSGIAAPELLQAIKARKEYARISVQHWLEEKHGKDITAQIYTPVGGALKAQKGTFSDSINAFTATLMQDISLLRSAHLNKAKTDLLDFLIDAGQVKPAEMKYDKGLGRMAPVRLEDPSRAHLSIMRDGEPFTYDVHRDIAKSFEYSAYESQKATEVINALNAPLRRLLVSNNPVWMIRNIFRDFRTTIKNIPEARVKSLPELAKLYKQAYGEVWEYVWKNNASDDIDELLRGKAITTDRVYGTKEMGYEDETARIADEFNVQFNPELSKISQQRFKKARQILDVLDRFGRVSELGGKVAGYKFLKSQRDKGFINPKTGGPRTDQEIFHVVRSRIGTPDFKRQGTGQIITNNLFMFSNVNKEGLRSAVESFNEDRAAYVWKTVLYNILPKLVLAAASAQIPWVKEVVNGLTDYQKDHYTVIPIPRRLVPGLGAMDSFAFLIPEDYEGQLAGALVNKIARGEFGGTKGAINEASQLVPYRWHPAISVGADLLEYYVNGMNPVDDFRGSHILPDSIYKAGGFDAHKEMGKYVWNNLGMRMFYNAKQGELDPELAPLKEALQFPVLNWLSAIATVTNRGHAERYRRIIEPIRKEYARKAVESEGRIKGHINLMGYDVPRTAKVELYKALKQEDLLPPDQDVNAFEKRYNRIKNKGRDDQRIVLLEYAVTNEEKAALLSQYEMELGAEQYKKLLQNLRRDGIISQETLLKKARGDKNGRNRRTNP
jgi:hypothetical protein